MGSHVGQCPGGGTKPALVSSGFLLIAQRLATTVDVLSGLVPYDAMTQSGVPRVHEPGESSMSPGRGTFDCGV